MLLHTATDDELITAACSGDSRAYTELDNRWRPRLRAHVRKRLQDPDIVEDLVQQALVNAFRTLPRFNSSISKWSSWLFTIQNNLMSNEFRRMAKSPVVQGEFFEVEDERVAADTLVLTHELQEQIQTILSGLKPAYKEALILSDVEGRSYDEIATLTQTNVGTVKSRLHRARLAFVSRFEV